MEYSASVSAAEPVAASWEAVSRYVRELEAPGLGGDQVDYLYELSRGTSGRGAIVEIGTYLGKSTIGLAYGQKEKGGRPVRTIDLVEHHDLERNLSGAGVREFVEVVVAPSTRAASGWAEPIELLWVDGDHSYRGVRADIRAWARHVVPGGLLAFHDYPGVGWSRGVARAVRRLIQSDPDRWRTVSDRQHGSIIVFERLEAARDAVPAPARVAQTLGAAARDIPALWLAKLFPRSYEALRRRLGRRGR